MEARSHLKTARFSPEEGKRVDIYLAQNPVFESFSSLARVAVLHFIGESATVHLEPVDKEKPSERPSFLWDYDLTCSQIKEILHERGLSDRKKWLMGRILKHARFEDIWKYLSMKDIREYLPYLRLDPKVKKRWEYAIKRWQ